MLHQRNGQVKCAGVIDIFMLFRSQSERVNSAAATFVLDSVVAPSREHHVITVVIRWCKILHLPSCALFFIPGLDTSFA